MLSFARAFFVFVVVSLISARVDMATERGTPARSKVRTADRRISWTKAVGQQCRQHRSQRIDSAHGQIDAPGNDDECGAYGHDGEKAGVFRQADELLGVEELVLLNHDPFRFPRGVRSELGQVDSAAKNRQQQAERNDHNDQTAFLKASNWTGRNPTASGATTRQ